MDEEIREQIIVAVERTFRVAGAQDYEQGLQQTLAMAEFVCNGLRMMQTKDGLRAVLDSVPSNSLPEEGTMLQVAEQLPQLLRVGFKMLAKQAASDLPAIGVGRPHKATPEQLREVVNYVVELYGKGCTLKGAKGRAAQKYHLSPRTIDRIWTQRGSLPKSPLTMQDILRLLSDWQS